jgi:hypothetical protein
VCGPAAEIKIEQGDDGTDQAFGLPKGQAEHRSQRQRRRNSQGRIARLAAARCPWLCLPRRDCRVGKPNGQTTTLPQGGIIGCRVRGPMSLRRDMTTTLGIGFERHGTDPTQ